MFEAMLWQALAALVVLLVFFGIGTAIGKHRVVDIAWGLGFAAVALVGYLITPRHWLITALTVLWGLRLALFIAWRSRGKPEDPRYARLLAGKSRWYPLFMVYLLQWVIVWFVSLPVQLAQWHDDGLSWWMAPGVLLWAVGMVFEGVGDWQLYAFQKAGGRGRVLDTGLWRYTRHPNYFGDACVWWGIWLVACATWPGVLTVLSPVLMTWFLAGKTGKPMTEAAMEARPGYAEYVARTSGFVPWFPRR
ncbi:DUF1295 domain-containing protein [Longispora urticae]